jgi:phenylalanyl-tRNA synthetase beta chain
VDASADVRALVRVITGIDAQLERGTMPGLHPGKTARIVAGEQVVGFVGAIDPRLRNADDLTDDVVAAVLFIDALPAPRPRQYIAPPKYPAVERDLAVVVDTEVSAAAIEATIRAATPLARRAEVFDEYRGPQIGAAKKSVAVRIVLQRDDATLTDVATEATVSAIVAALAGAHGAVLRG